MAVTALSYIPADTTLVASAFYDLGEQSECQLGNGLNVPAGTTDFGFVDTTYNVTKAQQLAGVSTQAF